MISAATEHPNVVQYIGSYHIPGRGSGDAEVERGESGGGRRRVCPDDSDGFPLPAIRERRAHATRAQLVIFIRVIWSEGCVEPRRA